jgi:hypothetical protein
MIFTDKKIATKTVKVRWYKYSDPNMGWGDAGTEMYAEFPFSAFIEKEEERLPKGCKDFYYTYEFTPEWSEKLKTIFGDCWWMRRGYEMTKDEKRKNEIREAENVLRIARNIKKFA